MIRNCPNLKFIDVAFTGVDHVDLEAAKEYHVAVSNASGYSNQSVAELVIGMILSLLRNVPRWMSDAGTGAQKTPALRRRYDIYVHPSIVRRIEMGGFT